MPAHLVPEGRDLVFARSVLQEKLRRAHNIPARHWQTDHGTPSADLSGVADFVANFARLKDNAVFRSGFHRWFFDEKTFVDLVDTSHELGLGRLRVLHCYNTPLKSLSFNAILAR